MAKRTKKQTEKILMVVNVKRETIDVLQIANRRFMYNSPTGILILGDEMYGKTICSSHAQEFHASKAEGASMIIYAGGLAFRATIHEELSILPPLSVWSSSIGDLTHYKCSLNLKAQTAIRWSGDFVICPKKDERFIAFLSLRYG